MWHFHKIINTPNTPISNNHHSVQKLSFGKKVIIWYKCLLLFDRVFSELFGRNFYPQFFRYRSWFEAFFYLHIGDGSGTPLKV